MTLAFSTGPLELKAGDLDAAEREYRQAVELARRMGTSGRMTNLAAGLADVLLDQGRVDEASDAVDLSRGSAAADDTSGQAAWRMPAARLSLSRGKTDEAVQLARESIAIAESIQELNALPDLLIRLAEVFRLAGLDEEARDALGRAVDASRRKGASADTQRAREILAALGTA
jgi:tetratricopeptide (TPR) repeat protein